MSIVISLDDQPINVPITALSPEGFRRWADSAEFPSHARITRVDDGILIAGTIAADPGLDFTIRIPQSASTPAGFSAWAISDEFPERGRISFLQQEIVVDMSPEETDKHSLVKMRISRVLDALVEDLALGKVYPDGVLLRNEDAQLSTVPDALFVSGNTLQTGRIQFGTRSGHADEYTELVGVADWVLEVVSRSSVRKDKRILRELYHRAGVAEYWLVDPLGEAIDFQILIHRPGGYEAAPVIDGWAHSPVFGRRFRLDRRRDQWGHWEYKLDVAESC